MSRARPIFEGSNQRRFRSNYSPKEIYTLTKQGLRLAGVWERQDEWWWGGVKHSPSSLSVTAQSRTVSAKTYRTSPYRSALAVPHIRNNYFFNPRYFFEVSDESFRRGFDRNSSVVKGEKRLIHYQNRSPLFKRK